MKRPNKEDYIQSNLMNGPYNQTRYAGDLDKYIDFLEQSKGIAIVPSDEEIYKEGRERFKGRAKIGWKAGIFRAGGIFVKSQIKTMPKELSEENVRQLKDSNFALDYLPDDGIKEIYKKILNHYSKQ